MTDLFLDNMGKNKDYQKKNHNKIIRAVEEFTGDKVKEWKNIEDNHPTHQILDKCSGVDILAVCVKRPYFISCRVQPDVSHNTFTIRVKTGHGSNNTEILKLHEDINKADIFIHCYKDQILIAKKEHISEALRQGKGYDQINTQDGAVFRVLSIRDIGSLNVHQKIFNYQSIISFGVL